MVKITCISRTLKYPVDESVYAGIPLSIRASANVSAQPVTDLVRITISLYSAGLYIFSSESYTFTPEATISSISFASLSASRYKNYICTLVGFITIITVTVFRIWKPSIKPYRFVIPDS